MATQPNITAITAITEHYWYFSPVFCSDCFRLYSHEGTTVEFFDPVSYTCVSLFQVLSC